MVMNTNGTSFLSIQSSGVGINFSLVFFLLFRSLFLESNKTFHHELWSSAIPLLFRNQELQWQKWTKLEDNLIEFSFWTKDPHQCITPQITVNSCFFIFWLSRDMIRFRYVICDTLLLIQIKLCWISNV